VEVGILQLVFVVLQNGCRCRGRCCRCRRMSVDEAIGTFADSHALQRVVEESEFIFGERVGDVAQLVGVDAHVVVGDETGDEFAVERIVR